MTTTHVLYRSLRRAIRSLRHPRPQLWDAIFNGTVRRTTQSQAMATLQSQATALDLHEAFQTGGSAALALPALGRLSNMSVPLRADAIDTGFAALRQLRLLDGALGELEISGAFVPMQRTPEVKFTIGQRVDHRSLGPCMIYGWDLSCKCVEPPHARALEAAGGPAGIVDNRRCFVGIDDVADKAQPFYRVQLREGRGHYAAQECLEAVPREHALRIPIQGSSFFFLRPSSVSGCLVPRPELASRYPEDAKLILAPQDGGAASLHA